MSLRDQIIAHAAFARETVEVPEWDVTVEVRSMSMRSRAAMLKQAIDGEGDVNTEVLYAATIVACCYDPETDKPVFTEKSDIDWLANQPAGVIERLASLCNELSGLRSKSQETVLESGKDDS